MNDQLSDINNADIQNSYIFKNAKNIDNPFNAKPAVKIDLKQVLNELDSYIQQKYPINYNEYKEGIIYSTDNTKHNIEGLINLINKILVREYKQYLNSQPLDNQSKLALIKMYDNQINAIKKLNDIYSSLGYFDMTPLIIYLIGFLTRLI